MANAGNEKRATGLMISQGQAKDQKVLQTVNTILSSRVSQDSEHLHFVVIRDPSAGDDYLSYPPLVESSFVDLHENLSKESLKWIA